MTPGQREEGSLKEKLRSLHEQVAKRWEIALVNDGAAQIARDYLVKRGVSNEAVSRRVATRRTSGTTLSTGPSPKHDSQLLEKGGLAIPVQALRPVSWLIFPICDEQGRVIGPSGRVLVADQKGGKYINSPETPIFSKSRVIYGLDKAKGLSLTPSR